MRRKPKQMSNVSDVRFNSKEAHDTSTITKEIDGQTLEINANSSCQRSAGNGMKKEEFLEEEGDSEESDWMNPFTQLYTEYEKEAEDILRRSKKHGKPLKKCDAMNFVNESERGRKTEEAKGKISMERFLPVEKESESERADDEEKKKYMTFKKIDR
ncbi:hypothetical protein RUM43_003599 [Polyplax serrata]|uniref:Uncharacterized protein n=1 Tax=Polyplax serrata TaxID=468196 RepID=A0AAN8S9F2_POLSC